MRTFEHTAVLPRVDQSECALLYTSEKMRPHRLGNGRAHLIAMRSEPLAGVIMILILETHGNAVAAVAPA